MKAIKIAEVFGVKIMADADTEIVQWYPNSPNMLELSMLIFKLDIFLRNGLMRIESIKIASDIPRHASGKHGGACKC